MSWFAILFQFYLIIINRVASVPETIIRFFSFFTILTNIMVAVCFTVLIINSGSQFYRFISKPTTLTAITVYITIVGIVYNLILRFLWKPQGWQRIVDELLHTVIPVLFILLWIFFVPKNNLKWRHSFSWLAYPFVYTLFILIRGIISNYYPYPFINVTALGYSKALLNGIGLLIAFLAFSLLYIGIGKLASRQASAISPG